MSRTLRLGLASSLLALAVQAAPGLAEAPAPIAAAPAAVVAELASSLERARARFEARDLAGVLAWVSDRYRSGGLTKAAVREQLAAMFALYQQLRASVTVERAEMVDDVVRVYTTGEVSGRLPVVGWVTVLTWQGEPEVARREAGGWRLFGFQD